MDTKIVYGMLIADGALVGVSESEYADSKRYWYGIEGEDWCLVKFTVPESFDAEGMVESGDMYTDADCLLNNCLDWIVLDCGDRPYMSPYFVFVDGNWHFANFDGSVGIEYWTPGEDDDSDNSDSYDDDDFEDDEY